MSLALGGVREVDSRKYKLREERILPEKEDVSLAEVAGGPGLHGGREALGGVVREVHFLKQQKCLFLFN